MSIVHHVRAVDHDTMCAACDKPIPAFVGHDFLESVPDGDGQSYHYNCISDDDINYLTGLEAWNASSDGQYVHHSLTGE